MIAEQLCAASWRQLCAAYALSPQTQVRALCVGENRTYAIAPPNGPTQVLRLSYAGAEAASIQAELQVLTYLAQATTLRVPRPIAPAQGPYLCSRIGEDPQILEPVRSQSPPELGSHCSLGGSPSGASGADLGGKCTDISTLQEHTQPDGDQSDPTLAAMFSFVAGEPIHRVASKEMLFRVGQTLGKLALALQRGDRSLQPAPSQFRRRWDGDIVINWVLEQLDDLGKSTQAQEGLFDLAQPSCIGPLNPPVLGNFEDFSLHLVLKDRAEIMAISHRLRHHCQHVKFWLPQQLIHADAHFDNLLWDGTDIGIIDFDNMGVGPRIYELAAPLHSLYELTLTGKVADYALWQTSLLAGYRVHVPLSDLELQTLPLFQAVHLLGVVAWTLNQSPESEDYRWLAQHWDPVYQRLGNLLATYEQALQDREQDIFRTIGWEGRKRILQLYSLATWQRLKRLRGR